MIDRLLLLGATGDLAGRFLLPALAESAAAGRLPDGLRVVGAGAQDWDEETFRSHVADRLDEHAADVPADVRRRLVHRLRYRRVDLTDAATVTTAVGALDDDDQDDDQDDGPAGDAAVAVYLALPPALFAPTLATLGRVGLPRGSRIAVEKPFGADLAGAQRLNELLDGTTGADSTMRVDHFLGMPRVRALLGLHRPGGPLAPTWSGAHLRQVDVLWEETLGLSGREQFYDSTGALRDVGQNHLLQVLVLVAMEQPASAAEADVHRAKLDLLRSVRVLSGGDLVARTRRARYTAGTLAGGGRVPAYAAADGVDAARGTETFAELVLEVDTPRWAGTPFVLRTGKAMAADRKGVALHFRGTAPDVDPAVAERLADDLLWIELDGARDLPSDVQVRAPGERTAYRAVLADVLTGGSGTSVTGAEAEQAWRIVDPVLRAWAEGEVPMLEHPAGTALPDRSTAG